MTRTIAFLLLVLPVEAALAATASSTAPVSLALVANAEAGFRARCRRQTLARNPQAAKWVDGDCAQRWQNAAAAGPAADALLNVLPAVPGGMVPTAVAKSRMTGVRWGAGATGRLGAFEASLHQSSKGDATPRWAALSWDKVGQPIPYDVVGAMEARGAKLTLMSCEKTGIGEGTRNYAGTAPGRAPFGLSVDVREAPTADANSHYGATITLDGRTPPRGNTACEDF